jgi:hypothetical protein
VKRSPELTPLSHHHHGALFLAMKLKRAEDEAPAAELAEFMAGKGERHFREEESILLPGWAAADPDADPALAARIAAEHLELRAAGRRAAAGGVGGDELHRLGELLEAHVRFEEREVFPLIESRLDERALAALGAALAAFG